MPRCSFVRFLSISPRPANISSLIYQPSGPSVRLSVCPVPINWTHDRGCPAVLAHMLLPSQVSVLSYRAELTLPFQRVRQLQSECRILEYAVTSDSLNYTSPSRLLPCRSGRRHKQARLTYPVSAAHSFQLSATSDVSDLPRDLREPPLTLRAPDLHFHHHHTPCDAAIAYPASCLLPGEARC